jgi:hypothetical protein
MGAPFGHISSQGNPPRKQRKSTRTRRSALQASVVAECLQPTTECAKLTSWRLPTWEPPRSRLEGRMTYCPTCLRYVNGAISCPGCGILASELDQAEPEATRPRLPDSDAARPVRLSHACGGVTRPSHTRARQRRKPLIVTALAAVTLTAGLAAASGLGILPGQTGPHTSSTPNPQNPQAGSLPYRPAAPEAQSRLASPRPTPAGNTATRTTTLWSSPSVPTDQPVAPPASVQSTPDTPPAHCHGDGGGGQGQGGGAGHTPPAQCHGDGGGGQG